MKKKTLILVLLLCITICGWAQNENNLRLRECKYKFKLEYNILSSRIVLSGEWNYQHLLSGSKFIFLDKTIYSFSSEGQNEYLSFNNALSKALTSKSINVPDVISMQYGERSIIDLNKQVIIDLYTIMKEQQKDIAILVMTSMTQLITNAMVCSNISSLMDETIISENGLASFNNGKSSYHININSTNEIIKILITSKLEKDGEMEFILEAIA